MRFAVYLPNCGEYADPERLVALSVLAEASGWDGLFLWDHLISTEEPALEMCDSWTALAAIAARTSRLRLGPLITPLARRRAGKVARETATLDRLSRGRLVLGIGLGHPVEEWTMFGEDGDTAVRVAELDEGLDALTKLWTGQPVHYSGSRRIVDGVQMRPTPVQHPRIPIWTATYWPAVRPDALPRVARWDGVFPLASDFRSGEPARLGVEAIADVRRTVGELRGDEAFDLIHGGVTEGPGDTTEVRAFAEAGATWWLELFEPARGDLAVTEERIRLGPPTIPHG